ncbi:hypothetical protein EJB05_03752 [Eragrostis curvula]|uniref:Uncharacterized protein n=1 Tax=Eragrostis curvula TaxID=38414 RepID=A0A5J9W8J7_9POAL|nr:hypothetical protein EJB05_03752 [Eragrostis curvula]
MGHKRNKRRPPPPPPPPGASLVDFIEWLGECGRILVLFETPSGFALFGYDGLRLFRPKALQNIWADFAKDYIAKDKVFLKEFQVFKDKASTINLETGVSDQLAKMIKKHIRPGQKLAVGKHEYKLIIEARLKISCLFDKHVMEVMWGLKNLMRSLVPQEELELAAEDRLPMSEGLKMVLKDHGFDVEPKMVSRRIIDMAHALYECDLCVDKYSGQLRSAGSIIQEVSGIDTQGWTLLKLASALKIICSPLEKHGPEMFSDVEVSKLLAGLSQYQEKFLKNTCLGIFEEIVWANGVKNEAKGLLNSLVKEARAGDAYEVGGAESPQKNQ